MDSHKMVQYGQIFQGSRDELRDFILQARSEGADVQMLSHDTVLVKSAWLSDESEPPIPTLVEEAVVPVSESVKVVLEAKEGHSRQPKPPPLFGKVEA